MSEDQNPNALKHHFNQEFLKRIGKAIGRVYPDFDQKMFLKNWRGMQPLEMKPRVRLIRDSLRNLLPQDYVVALKILLRSTEQGDLGGFDLWPYTEFIQTFGLDHLERSLDALKKLTPLFTSEWAIRPFIVNHPEQSLSYLLQCAHHENHHVRRWASEGSRPRLPWGERLKDFVKDPKPTAAILDALKFDDELYVRKSVANHLNDIAKDHPDYVLKTLKRWQKECKVDQEKQKKIDWIIRHSLRTLIKQGYPLALRLIGVSPCLEIEVRNFKLHSSNVVFGKALEFSFDIGNDSSQTQTIVIDYVLHFLRARGETRPKVFKLKKMVLKPGEVVRIKKVHPLKAITTREYYSGHQHLELQINGEIKGRKKWHLSI